MLYEKYTADGNWQNSAYKIQMHTKSFSLFDISANNKFALSINRRAFNQD